MCSAFQKMDGLAYQQDTNQVLGSSTCQSNGFSGEPPSLKL
jgi:hypothetical protein